MALAAGAHFTCAVLNTGGVSCWGANGAGQLGVGKTSDVGAAPGQMGSNLTLTDLGTGHTAQISSSFLFLSCTMVLILSISSLLPADASDFFSYNAQEDPC